MSEIDRPLQIRYNDPSQQQLYQYNTVDSRIYLSRATNLILNSIGNDLVLKGLDIRTVTITSKAFFSYTSGYAIQDSTLLEIISDGVIDFDVATLDDSSQNCYLGVFLDYNYLDEMLPNIASIRTFHFNLNNPSLTVITPSQDWDEDRDRILLSAFYFIKDSNQNIIEILPIPSIIINSRTYWKKGRSPEFNNLNIDFLRDSLFIKENILTNDTEIISDDNNFSHKVLVDHLNHDSPQGTSFLIPEAYGYIADLKHLLVSKNGLRLTPQVQYNEVVGGMYINSLISMSQNDYLVYDIFNPFTYIPGPTTTTTAGPTTTTTTGAPGSTTTHSITTTTTLTSIFQPSIFLNVTNHTTASIEVDLYNSSDALIGSFSTTIIQGGVEDISNNVSPGSYYIKITTNNLHEISTYGISTISNGSWNPGNGTLSTFYSNIFTLTGQPGNSSFISNLVINSIPTAPTNFKLLNSTTDQNGTIGIPEFTFTGIPEFVQNGDLVGGNLTYNNHYYVLYYKLTSDSTYVQSSLETAYFYTETNNGPNLFRISAFPFTLNKSYDIKLAASYDGGLTVGAFTSPVTFIAGMIPNHVVATPGLNNIDLSWIMTKNDYYYKIEYGTTPSYGSSHIYQLSTQSATLQPTYNITGLNSNTLYYYKITPWNWYSDIIEVNSTPATGAILTLAPATTTTTSDYVTINLVVHNNYTNKEITAQIHSSIYTGDYVVTSSSSTNSNSFTLKSGYYFIKLVGPGPGFSLTSSNPLVPNIGWTPQPTTTEYTTNQFYLIPSQVFDLTITMNP